MIINKTIDLTIQLTFLYQKLQKHTFLEWIVFISKLKSTVIVQKQKFYGERVKVTKKTFVFHTFNYLKNSKSKSGKNVTK
jgi:hypothetical protein